MPWWDTGAIPMDDLPVTRIVFADVEPEGSLMSSLKLNEVAVTVG